MKIVVFDIPAESGGALSILKSLYNFIKNESYGYEWIFVVSTVELAETINLKVNKIPWIKKSWLHRLFWDLFVAPFYVKSLKPDIIISLQNLTIPFTNIPQILYLHQPIPFQEIKSFSFFKHEERSLAFYQHIIGKLIYYSLQKASVIIVQTQWMKNAIQEKIRKNTNKDIFIIHPEVNHHQVDDLQLNLKKSMNRQKIKFFYPTSAIPYKNIECLINAANILAIMGEKNFEVFCTINGNENCYGYRMKRLINELKCPVNLVGNLSQKDVYHTYFESVLIFPSYIETYGLPLAEAKKVGSIILASDCPFSREILFEYKNAYFFNPFQPEDLAEIMRKIIKGEIIKEENFIFSNNNKNNNWDLLVPIIERMIG